MNRAERLDDTEESLRLAQENAQAQMWTALPGIVKAVDLAKQTCSVQPAIRGSVTDKEGKTSPCDLPLLVDVPIVFPRAGGFALTFPVQEGDECLVVFASRCIDAWWQNSGVQEPAEWRMHDLSDGFAILAPTSQPRKLDGVLSDAVHLRTDDGQAFVKIDSGYNITAKTPAKVDIDAGADITVTTGANINLKAGGQVNIDASNVNLKASTFNVQAFTNLQGWTSGGGGGTVNGGLRVNDGLTVTGDAVIDGVSFDNHTHTGVHGETSPPH